MATQGDGHPGKGVEPVAGASALLESRDDGLRRAHALGQRTLGGSCFGAQVVDQLAKRQVLFDVGSDTRRHLANVDP